MKQLKSLLIAAILFIGAGQAVSAQAKVAHINVQELMSTMPDMKAANTQLEKIGKTYEAEYKTLVQEYQTKIEKYEKEAPTVGDAMKPVTPERSTGYGRQDSAIPADCTTGASEKTGRCFKTYP
jgi:outer membrane protein